VLARFLDRRLSWFKKVQGYRTVKSRETSKLLNCREVEENSRKVEELQRIICEFDQMAADLELQIKIEEERTRVRDQSHFSYSTFAKAAALRRDNLRQSTKGLRASLAAAVRERDGKMEQISRAAGREDGNRRDTPFAITATH
jgi:flagellar protein FliJ